MKTVTMNSAAATSVMTTMETILSTTVGTATEGAVTMTGEEYLEAITIFVQLLEVDMSSAAIVTQSLSLTSVATTLTAAQVNGKTVFFHDVISGDINYFGEDNPDHSNQSDQYNSCQSSSRLQKPNWFRSHYKPNHLWINIYRNHHHRGFLINPC